MKNFTVTAACAVTGKQFRKTFQATSEAQALLIANRSLQNEPTEYYVISIIAA